MPLPLIVSNNLSPLGALPPAAPPPHALALGGAGGGANPLAFTMFPQEQSNWCWSAVALSVSQFYNAASTWMSQCQVASSGLGVGCCPSGSNLGNCDVPWYLDRALTLTNNYNTNAAAPATVPQIQAEIAGVRPLGVRIGWSNGGGHFLCVTGWSTVAGVDYVTVEDPIYAQSTLPYSSFCSNYQGSGAWTHSYWTQP
jgi:hypothetical protein